MSCPVQMTYGRDGKERERETPKLEARAEILVHTVWLALTIQHVSLGVIDSEPREGKGKEKRVNLFLPFLLDPRDLRNQKGKCEVFFCFRGCEVARPPRLFGSVVVRGQD